MNLYNYAFVCVLYCGGHHDSDRMAVLVCSEMAMICVSRVIMLKAYG